MTGIDYSKLKGFRPDRRRSCEPDATEGRELAHATAERDARISLNMWPGRVKLRKV